MNKTPGKKIEAKKRHIAEKMSGKATLVRHGTNFDEKNMSDKNDDRNKA